MGVYVRHTVTRLSLSSFSCAASPCRGLPKSKAMKERLVPSYRHRYISRGGNLHENLVVTQMSSAKLNRGREQLKWNNLFVNHWRLAKLAVLYALTHENIDSVPMERHSSFPRRVVWLLWSTLWSNLWDDSFDTCSSRRRTGCSLTEFIKPVKFQMRK